MIISIYSKIPEYPKTNAYCYAVYIPSQQRTILLKNFYLSAPISMRRRCTRQVERKIINVKITIEVKWINTVSSFCSDSDVSLNAVC